VFLAAGGKSYGYIAALNARPDHVAALRGLVLRESGAESAAATGAVTCSG
jgi:protoheme ferro-lyase